MTAPVPIRPASTLPQVGEVVAQRYSIERFIARGGMSHVFAARHTALGSVLALKVLDPKLFDGVSDAKVRFEREARLASRLRHPSIVEVFDIGVTEGGLPFIAMELLDGSSLSKVLREEAPMSWRRASGLILQVLDALQVAHSAGAVHRDVKPDNCLILRDSDHVKLLDFGIARVLHETQVTAAGSVMGTPHYLSPEQAMGATTDSRTDVYSAGIVLYEMLTGRCPFEEGTAFEIVGAHIAEPPPPLSSIIDVSELPEELPALMERVLAKVPNYRPADAGAFAAELRAIDTEPADVGVRPGVWVAAAAAAFVIGVGAVGIASFMSGDPLEAEPMFAALELDAPSVSAQAEPEPEADPPQHELFPSTPLAEPFVPGEEEPAEPTEEPHDEAAKPVEPDDEPKPSATRPPNKKASRRRGVARSIRKAASVCARYAPPGGALVSVEVEVSVDGDLQGTQIKPPYAGSVLGKCVARALGNVSVGAGPAVSFGQRVRIGGGR